VTTPIDPDGELPPQLLDITTLAKLLGVTLGTSAGSSPSGASRSSSGATSSASTCRDQALARWLPPPADRSA
jgi:hypothetical protein